MIPRNCNVFTLSITVASILSIGLFKALLIILYSMYFYLLTLRDNLFLTIHLFWLIHYLLSCYSYRNWTEIKLAKCQSNFRLVLLTCATYLCYLLVLLTCATYLCYLLTQVTQIYPIPHNISMLWLCSIGQS